MLLIEGLEYVLQLTESVNIILFDRQINACDTRQATGTGARKFSLKSVDNSRVFYFLFSMMLLSTYLI